MFAYYTQRTKVIWHLLHDMKTSDNQFFDLSRALNSAIFNLAVNWSLFCTFFFPLFFPHGWEIAFFELWKQPLIRVNFCVAFHQLSSPSLSGFLCLFPFVGLLLSSSILPLCLSMNFEKNMLRSSLWWWQQFGFHIFLSSRHYLVLLQCLCVCVCVHLFYRMLNCNETYLLFWATIWWEFGKVQLSFERIKSIICF